MNITILCSDFNHPVYSWLERWAMKVRHEHEVSLITAREQLIGGDFLFLVSCSELIDTRCRECFRYTLVLHASDLPQGRGWSPHVWEIVNGACYLTLSLLEAEDKVDSGRIWLKKRIPISRTALWCEVNELLFAAEVELIDRAVKQHMEITPLEQSSENASFYRRRMPSDSVLDPQLSLEQQFDLLRMCDPDRYPATFTLRGQKYKLTLEKVNDDINSN